MTTGTNKEKFEDIDTKPIVGFEDYLINKNGVIISLKNKSLKIKKTCFSTLYPTLTLCMNGKMHMFRLHRLLSQHFIPNPNNLKEVNHKDGNKHNYSLSNLEWCSPSDNLRHAYSTGLRTANKVNPKLNKPVGQYTKQGELVRVYESVKLAESTNCLNHVSCVCRGTRLTSGGYKWKYITKEAFKKADELTNKSFDSLSQSEKLEYMRGDE